jgi:hypothetical protein
MYIAFSRQKAKCKINLSPMTFMKQILFALLLLPFFVTAQQLETSETGLPIKDGKVVFERVFEVTNYKRDDIYASVKKWVVDSFKNIKKVIESEDKESGQFIGVGSTEVKVSDKNVIYTMEFLIQVNCKDDRYRARFYDIKISEMRAGIIHSDLRVAGNVIPIEKFAYFQNGKNSTQKQIESGSSIAKHVSNHFRLILETINSSVKTSTTDNF